MRQQLMGEVSAAGAKLTPVVGVAGAGAAGWGVQEWMYAATVVYVALQAAYLVWKWRREARQK